jgi:poly(3-hydroxybutyrate) depolymerase
MPPGARERLRRGVVVLGLLGQAFESMAARLASGQGAFTCLAESSQPLTVFTYKPASFNASSSPLVAVFHGITREAREYRDYCRGLADSTGALIIAPRFDKDR